MESLNCESLGTRLVNQRLRALSDGARVRLVQPRGRHNLAVGLSSQISIEIEGNAATSWADWVGTATAPGPTSSSTVSWGGRWART